MLLTVNPQLAPLIRLHHGVIKRSEATEVVPSWVFDHAVRVGHLVRLFPRAFVRPADRDQPSVRHRAALRYAGPGAALSHTSALAVWGFPVADPLLHLTTDVTRRLRGAPGLVVHRRPARRLGPPTVLIREGLPVLSLEWSIVDSWPLLTGHGQRAPAIRAVAARMTTPDRLRSVLDGATRLAGRADLARLLDLLAAGCHSELEIWGYEQIFRTPGMPKFARQVPVRLGSRTVYLDMFAEAERVNIELDGAAWHSSPSDRERDLRRDSALAALGILVVRFSHRRLTRDPDEVRRDVLKILAHPPSRLTTSPRPPASTLDPAHETRRRVSWGGSTDGGWQRGPGSAGPGSAGARQRGGQTALRGWRGAWVSRCGRGRRG